MDGRVTSQGRLLRGGSRERERLFYWVLAKVGEFLGDLLTDGVFTPRRTSGLLPRKFAIARFVLIVPCGRAAGVSLSPYAHLSAPHGTNT